MGKEHVARWHDVRTIMFVDVAYCHVCIAYWQVVRQLHCDVSLLFQCRMGDLDLKYMLSFDLN